MEYQNLDVWLCVFDFLRYRYNESIFCSIVDGPSSFKVIKYISCDSDIPISDIPELAWDASSFSESYDYSDSFLGSLDCNSITTHYDFLDTHSEHDFVSHKQNQVKIYPSKIIKR